MNKSSEQAIIEAAIAALNDVGVDARARNARGKRADVDAIVTLRHGNRTLEYVAEVKRRLTPALIGPITLAFTQSGENRLLVTDYVTPPIAEAFRRHGVQFADTAGNAHLQSEGLLVVISGRRLKSTAPRVSPLRVFRRSGLQILFVLISAPNFVSAPFRTIAEVANVSLGSVPPVLDGLRELGFIVHVNGTRRLVDRDRLIDQWVEGYARRLQPSLEMGRFRASTPDWWRRVDLTSYGVQWGSETAAALLQRHLRPEHAIIYTDGVPTRLLSEHRLKADPTGEIFLRRRFWNSVPSPRTDIVPPLLIYADLVAVGDARSLAAAKQIRKTYLD
ncbi:MAG TPA: type IV toxin-antitoxin system AbiEi family antitoxin [Thermoanaerobaculia bacterium]|nr:type IV toxin-antitoxin system AbiEi family antitoxin [Thermoanaerobaculia bacterium]